MRQSVRRQCRGCRVQLSSKTLEKLRELINEETEYRSGPQLVAFFNELGFENEYGQGFPSRWMFTDGCLEQLNGTANLDRCIKMVFAPINFVQQIDELDAHIDAFNQYLAFDKWRLVRDNAEITFQRLEKVVLEEPPATREEDSFLAREFSDLNIPSLGLETALLSALALRVQEIERCFTAHSPLAVILLAGSTLEGLLLGLAVQFPRQFNQSSSSPKDSEGKVKPFHDWTLASLIDAAREVGLIEHDVQKFSHALRDFRNYIHPFEQVASGFAPSLHTARISLQVLKVAIVQVSEHRGNIGA